MPAFHPMQDVFSRSDYPPQYLHPKYDGPNDFRMGYPPAHTTTTSELDLHHPDPYNYGKHSSMVHSTYNSYGTFDSFGLPRQLGAPVAQHIQIDSRYVPHQYGVHRNYQAYPERQPQEDKVVGGVSAQLDYEMDKMTDFVVEMSSGLVKPPAFEQNLFRKWVLQVLNATRLPSATIILSLSYLAHRVRGLKSSGTFASSERGMYQMLTVALILGSKFLDDNTFQNKSWAEVSNIPVQDLNRDEIAWLEAFGHRLHYNPEMPDGFNSWQKQWEMFRSKTSASLHPLDTAHRNNQLGRQNNSHSRYSTQFQPSLTPSTMINDIAGAVAYPLTYSPYESWNYQRSTQGSSPSTAPHTGPTTPEYYATAWGQTRTYSARDIAYDFATLPHFTPINGTGFEAPAYDCTLPSMWNCHGNACQCSNCRQSQVAPRYGPITAA